MHDPPPPFPAAPADAPRAERGRPDAVLLLGPTASGKSAIAMALARRIPLEIVSVDSALVYRGMDIGTAKPDAADRRAVPHHLLDLLDPAGAYSAAAFVADARRLIPAIRARGRLPLLVGGTMLYAKALSDGLDALPAADPAIRAALDSQAAEIGWPAMHTRLAQIDPATAARLEPGDSQRIQRALEVHALTGRPMSALLTGGAATRAADTRAADTRATGTRATGTDAAGTDATDTDAAGTHATGTHATGTDAAGTHATGTHATGTHATGTHATGTHATGTHATGTDAAGTDAASSDAAAIEAARLGAAPLRLLTIALEPPDRAVLHARIAARFEAMLAAGLLDEVRGLRARGDLHPGLPSMRCVGYRQAWRYLDNLEHGDDGGAQGRRRFVEEALAATRQLAKRQLTWLRAMPQRQVVDCLAPNAADRVSAIIAAHGH